MKRLLFGMFAAVLLSACQPLYHAERSYKVYEKEPEFFQNLMNTPPENQNAKPSVVLEDSSYPISLQLYQDGRFYYYLKRLGDGWGNWDYKKGYLHLYAERKLFVMNFEIHSIDPESSAVSLEFSDRFGPKFLKLQQQTK